ncbi:hypothetical protein [Palleronia caenipelagi]|uniref:Uncharacterized protein n=1 Tax=Palleronia caenipelagi TaxID=2489174 RepID=A0A547QA80_9RHOB|nr:hypothetical protein [Palleronia caenipelagi]TRD23317.1 hypothetical protein FEV53_01795 [Palleronia caenipelagi]
MKLSVFVQTTLEEIAKGVSSAKNNSRSNDNVWIAPGYLMGKEVASEQQVQFDVLVTSSVNGDGGVDILGLADLKGGYSHENSNRVSFSVPVYFQALGGGS